MKIAKIKKEKIIDSRNDKSLGIQTFGENNDYPQQVMEIVKGSCTGLSCVGVYSKFINGQGFYDSDFFNLVINRDGLTTDVLLSMIAYDYAIFNGFAIHVNYNANFKITQLNFAPFETVRLGALNDAGKCTKACLHWDWGRRMGNLRRWSKEDIDEIDLFNPDPNVIRNQVNESGGWGSYKGQILYFNPMRGSNYPLPIFSPVLTDMSTEQGVSNISYRNARNNFLTSGMLIDIMNEDESEEQENETEKEFLKFQGDEESQKIVYAQAKSKEEAPTFIDFSGKNYDKEFTITHEKVKGDIGRSFNQPPILRAEDVGSNFGADALRNAYDYYNSVTEVERSNISRVFQQIFKYWKIKQFNDFTISPLSYGQQVSLYEKYGKDGIEKIDQILSMDLENDIKKKRLSIMFDLSDSELEKLGL